MTYSSRLLRSLYLAGFFILLPLLGAAFLVWLLAPADGYTPSGAFGWVLTVFRDQRVPVGIVLFTLLEILLWNQRQRLPWSDLLNVPTRTDVPARYQRGMERASLLLEEAERILGRNRRAVERELSVGERGELEAALDELRSAMQAVPFEPEAFDQALIKADGEVDVRLGRWRKGELREYTESIGIAVAVALLLRVFVVEAFKIPSGSMIPTLQIGDHIFVNKMSYGPLVPWTQLRVFPHLPPRRGDVMVFEFPENREQDFIKRVIATPGDRLEVKDGHPIINGWHAPSCSIGTYPYREVDSSLSRRADLVMEYLEDKVYLTQYERTFANPVGEVQGPYFVKPGEVWVLGDNRNNSHDSRGWFEGKGGGVPFDHIKGKAMFVWLSFDPSRKTFWDIAWERIGVSIMGQPQLPPLLEAQLKPAFDACLAKRPPLSATTPPPPSAQ